MRNVYSYFMINKIIYGTINYNKIIKHNIFTTLKPAVRVEEIF